MKGAVEVVVGTPIYREGAYIIDRFLDNQRDIQAEYPESELALATNEADFAKDLERSVNSYGLRARVILYETTKPDHARSRIWNVACGRESIREYVLSQTEARYLLSLDADMTYESAIVRIMKEEIQGYDAVFSGCPLRQGGVGLAGAGCMMLTKGTLENVRFRCVEFKNGEVMFEDNLLEYDLFRRGGRIKRGFFLHASHYRNASEARHIMPQPVGMYQRVMTSAQIRHVLIGASLITKRNIPWRLKMVADRLRGDAS